MNVVVVALILSVVVAPVPPSAAAGETVRELVDRGWTATQIASSPDFPSAMAELSDREYWTFLSELIALAHVEGYTVSVLRSLRRQGVPQYQTCQLAREIVPVRPGNPMGSIIHREAGC